MTLKNFSAQNYVKFPNGRGHEKVKIPRCLILPHALCKDMWPERGIFGQSLFLPVHNDNYK
jgi:hypothetical protein